MKNKKDIQFYVKRAIDDVKSLLIYYNITRPQQLRYFHVGGKFSRDEMKRQMAYVHSRNDKKDMPKNEFKLFIQYSNNINNTFGIPSDRIKDVVGTFKCDGKTKRIPVESIINQLLTTGYISKVINNGNRHSKDKQTTYGIRCKKYILNEEVMNALFNDKAYADINTFPTISKRIQDKIWKWIDQDLKDFGKQQKVKVCENTNKPKVEKQPKTSIVKEKQEDKMKLNRLTQLSQDEQTRVHQMLSNVKDGIFTIDYAIDEFKKLNFSDEFIDKAKKSYDSYKSKLTNSTISEIHNIYEN